MKVGENGRPFEILLIEDDPGAVRLTYEALKMLEAPKKLHLAFDGLEALAFLRQEGRHRDAPRPDLILLDLLLPRRDGLEILTEIKTDRALKSIPLIVMTNSRDDEDIHLSYDLQANCFIRKPVDLDQFLEVFKSIESFWLSVADLPRNAVS
ncbi:MAG: response regulator [Anaerolineales bacterium]